MAFWRRQPAAGILHHSDRGSQYASYEYRQHLDIMQMQQSMSRKGNCFQDFQRKTLPYKILAQIVMVIDNLVLSEYVCRYKKLHINNADDCCFFGSQLMIICEHHYVSEHCKWLFGEDNQRPVYCITQIEGANMQAISIVNTWISCKCSRV
jgi:hypothetical protein